MTRLPSIARGMGTVRRRIALAVCLFCAPVARAAPEYTFHEIVIPGGTVWGAMDINNEGLVSGSAVIGGVDYGFIYSISTGTSATYSAGAWTSPGGINDAGEIVGRYEDDAHSWHTFVGTPVPEPGTAVLLLAGLVAARRFGLRRTGRHGHDARP